MSIFDNVSIFGVKLTADKKDKLETFEVEKEPGTAVVSDGVNEGGAYVMPYEAVAMPQTEIDSIKTYRTMSVNSDVDLVLNEIRNEVFIFDVPGKRAVDITFSPESKVSESIQKKIHEEYEQVYHVMQFDKKGIEYFDSWYVDGRVFFHKVIDTNDKKSGIKRIVKVDPIKMRKVREVPKRDAKGIVDLSKVKEYYIYTDQPESLYGGSGFVPTQLQMAGQGKNSGLKIIKDAVTYCDSGIYHEGKVHGFLHKAIVPFNNLKMMEESLLIYRVSRAPERRVIYVDVGNLPKNKAEQYVRELMNRFKNKLVYDSKTGSVADKRNVMSMIEDYWLPRRDGGKGTEITTLPGGDNLGITADVEYFKNKLMDSLNVPASRFSPDQAPTFAFGKGVEIQRDEYRFKKFIDRLRQRFVHVFEDLLKTQLLLKNIITEDDWFTIRNELSWVYAEDNAFVEYKESEALNNRINTLTLIDPFVGKYYSRKWVMANVLKMSDNEIKSMTDEMAEDQADMVDRGLMQDPNAEETP